MQTPIKLVVLMPNLNAGGTEKVICTLLNNLSPALFEVHVVYLAGSSLFFPLERWIQQHVLPYKRVRYTGWHLLLLLYRLRPKIVLSVLDFSRYMALLSPLLPSDTCLITRVSHVPASSKHGVKHLFNKLLYRKFRQIIVQSLIMKEFFIKNYAIPSEKISVLYNPVDYSMIQKQRLAIPSVVIPQEKPLFVTVGRLAAVKGYDRILKALALVPFDFTYWIIGRLSEAIYAQLCLQIANTSLEKKVVFLGEQPNPYQFLHYATVYLQGSYTEGYPNALLEAQACGKPCVVYDIGGGTNEAMIEGFNGFIIPNNQIQAYAYAIQQALATTFDATQIQAYVKHKHDITTSIEQFTQILVHHSPID